MRLAGWIVPLVLPASAAAHGTEGDGADLASILGAVLLAGAWLLYLPGAWRRPPLRGQRRAFHAAMGIAVLALFGPLDRWSTASTTWHMVQHLALMAAVAPLLGLAAPLPQWCATCGRAGHHVWTLVRCCGRHPLALGIVHGVAVWAWHAPAPYMLAVERPLWHMAEHACFVVSGALFWWSVLHAGPRLVAQALLALLVVLLQTGVLGALLTFAAAPFYGESRSLEDQQLAGLIMWVPGGLAYLAAGAWIAWRRLLEEPAGSAVAGGDWGEGR